MREELPFPASNFLNNLVYQGVGCPLFLIYRSGELHQDTWWGNLLLGSRKCEIFYVCQGVLGWWGLTHFCDNWSSFQTNFQIRLGSTLDFFRCWSSTLENKIVSSAYCSDITPPSLKSVRSPLIRPCSEAFLSILVSTSPTKLNNRGEIGSLCLKPFPGLKTIFGDIQNAAYFS